MNRILVPYDFSDVSQHAFEFAVQVAERTDATEVLLLNIVEHPSASRLKFMGVSDMDPFDSIYFSKLIKTTKEKLETLITENDHGNVTVKYKIKMGDPFNTVSSEIAEAAVDCVIMGTSGSEGIDELFVGSNAERVVRAAKCPVITLKKAIQIADINDIVLASDFDRPDDTFAVKVKELQTMMDAEMKIVKINTPANFTTTRHDKAAMQEFVEKYDIKNYQLDVYNYNNEEDGIVCYADDIDADMIAMGTYQRKGLNRFLSGSIAEDVVNHTDRPVWTHFIEV
jgi:nucleotide-binding universal stress UspA family protein